MQSFIIKVRRGERFSAAGGHTMKKIRLNKSQLQKGNSPSSEQMIQVISEISDLIKFNGVSKLNPGGASKNVVKYRTNAQPRTLSQIQNFPNSNVVTSITNIEHCKVKSSASSSMVPSVEINQVKSVNSTAKTSSAPSSLWSSSTGSAATITVGNIPPKADSQFPRAIVSSAPASGCCIKPLSTPIVVTSPNNLKTSLNFTNSSFQRSTNSIINDTQPHYTIQLKTSKNSIGSPTITSTSTTPVKTIESKPPSLSSQRPHPIFIRKDLGAKEDSVPMLNDPKNDEKSDWDDEEFDEDFDDREMTSAPIRTFCVSTGSCKSNSRPCLDASCYKRYSKSKVFKISTDSSRSQKVNVIGKSSFVPVNSGNRCQQSETGKKVDEVIEEILSLEESQGLRHVDSTYQPNSDVLSLGPDSTSGGDLPRVKLEEPQVESEAQMIAIIKDRQKKDSHNMIERRRRFNINDRIKELATLLPKTHEPYFDLVRDLRHNKGEILKASVDYIRRMKSDVEASKESEAKRRSLEQQNRQLHLKIQELEARLRQNGLEVEGTNLSPSLIPTLISSENQPQTEQSLKLKNINNNIASRIEGSRNTSVHNITCSPSTNSNNVNTNDTNINSYNSNFNINVSHATNTVQTSNPFNQNNANINCSTSQSQSNPFSFKAECSAESSTCNNVIASRTTDCDYNEDSDFSTINLDAMENLTTHGLSFNTNIEDTINTSICSPRVTSSNLSPGNFLSPDRSSTYSAPPDRSPEALHPRLDTPTSNYSSNLHSNHQFSNTNLLMPSSDLLTRTLAPDAITREALTRDALSSDDLTPEDLTPLFPASDHLLGSEDHGASSRSNFDDHSRNDCSSDSLRNDDRKVRPFHCLSESECHDDMSLINELLQDLNAHPFGLDLMEDDPVSGVYSCDPMFSSPQVPSTPYDSPSSLHESLSPDSMDIVS
ncbi:Myc-type basic helix-loop-helix (bHLH) domain [Trinorchestia longiramus]|nr:Myc-type basic helix-loop-helix (bHLH) domain [Trinorchestia longiramus]